MLPPNAPDASKLLQYWTSIEYLQPQEVPKEAPDKLTWAVTEDHQFPWIDIERRTAVFQRAGLIGHAARAANELPRKYGARIYVGVIEQSALSANLRALFPNDGGESQERDPTGRAAVMMVTVNHAGLLIGPPQISSVPWAMGLLHRQKGGPLSGFGGSDGFEQTAIEMLTEHFEPYVARDDSTEDTEDESAGDKQGEPDRTRGAPIPIKVGALIAGLDRLLSECGWGDSVVARKLIVSVTQLSTKADAAGTDLLNSFFTEDLQRVAGDLQERGRLPPALGCYLGNEAQHIDVRRDANALQAAILPGRLPHGAWPSKFPLARAQQFAVNQILSSLGDPDARGLYAVNGPPGTGKTTLLKDVIAGIIVRRAEAMVSGSGAPTLTRVRKDVVVEGLNGPKSLWAFDDESFLGQGIVVASGNNGAVENISKDLPVSKAIHTGDIGDLSYFREVAERVFTAGETRAEVWGLISAALGNSENQRRFVSAFWFGETAKGPNGGPPDKDAANPPATMKSMLWAERPEAVPSWQDATAQFASATAAVRKRVAFLHDVAERIRRRSDDERSAMTLAADVAQLDGEELTLRATQAARDLQIERHIADRASNERSRRVASNLADVASRAVTRARECGVTVGPVSYNAISSAVTDLRKRCAQAAAEVAAATRQHAALKESEPGRLARIFKTRAYRDWVAEGERLKQRAKSEGEAQGAASESIDSLQELQRELVRYKIPPKMTISALQAWIDGRCQQTEKSLGDLHAAIEQDQKELRRIDAARSARRRESRLITDRLKALDDVLRDFNAEELKFFVSATGRSGDPDAERAAPWNDRKLVALRAQCFAAAMNVHSAFIFERAAQFRDNLQLWVNLLRGTLRTPLKASERQMLWETFFLVVPVVSTTFASVGRMFSRLGRESLGWLFVDEAGQATPQMAVGALWRSKRAVIVGDPLQLEPVVTMTDDVLIRLARQQGLDTAWANRSLSVQNLGDRASVFGTYLGDTQGDPTWVGSPLLVHRRCLEPMFGIANRAAYDGMMVFGTPAGGGAAATLPPSCWIDISSVGARDHAVPRQTAAAAILVKALLTRLGGAQTADGRDNLFVLSPFRDAVRACKGAFGSQGAMKGRVGTIHTFQGKEAEVLIIVLGGNPNSRGAITGFAAAKPNLLNVAVTRARSRLYVIGDRPQWVTAPYFEQLKVLPAADLDDLAERVRGSESTGS